jgi:hypothetical protein
MFFIRSGAKRAQSSIMGIAALLAPQCLASAGRNYSDRRQSVRPLDREPPCRRVGRVLGLGPHHLDAELPQGPLGHSRRRRIAGQPQPPRHLAGRLAPRLGHDHVGIMLVAPGGPLEGQRPGLAMAEYRHRSSPSAVATPRAPRRLDCAVGACWSVDRARLQAPASSRTTGALCARPAGSVHRRRLRRTISRPPAVIRRRAGPLPPW